MEDIDSMLLRAKSDSRAADALIEKYMPFIKAETAKFISRQVTGDDDDELSIAMFAFYEALMSYEPKKGAFFSLASVSIKNRLIDYARKEERNKNNISLSSTVSSDDERTLEETIESGKNEIEEFESRTATKEEIEEYCKDLATYGLTLSDIAANCPKQERSFQTCMKVLSYALENEKVFDSLILTKKLPLSMISKGSGVSEKFLDRTRKYLIGILLAYTNGFEIIRGHLNLKRKEVAR